MFYKIFGGRRMAVVVPVLAALATLVAVDSASAIHPRGVPSCRPALNIRPSIVYPWLNYIGVRAMTGDNGAVFLSVNVGGLADQAGLESGDSIQSVDGTPVSTPQQLNDAIAAASANGVANLMVFDVNDPGQPAVPLPLPLSAGVAPQRARAHR